MDPENLLLRLLSHLSTPPLIYGAAGSCDTCSLQGTHNVANLQKIMTRIGGVCLVTIGIWCVIELAVQFGHYGHSCKLGEGAP